MTKSKKIRNLILAGCLLVWWISLAIYTKWEDFVSIFTLCFAGCWMLWTLLKPNTPKQKDEMTKKAGYTALALTLQLYFWSLCLVFIANAFYNFLDLIPSQVALLYSMYLIIFLSRWCYAYYLRHPEKTWL
jgi:uncharacterized membrane protein YfcA